MKKIFFILTITAICWSCSSPSTDISGCISAPAAKISITQLGATTQVLLDTLRTDAKGCFRYTLKIKQNEPVFLLLKTDSAQIATLLVNKGEKIQLEAGDKSGRYVVSGSEGSLLMQELNNNFNTSMLKFDSLYRVLKENEGAKNYEEIYKKINYELGDVYVKQKRASIKFIFQHPKSFASIAAIYQRYPTGLQVFASPGDAIYFTMLHDSLRTLYPKSDYTVALRDEIDRRDNAGAVQNMAGNIPEVGFPDLELPDINAKKIKLSSLQGKVVLLYFWLSNNTEQRMENNELRRLYDRYAAKGFDIYQIALDTDKPAWAKQVKTQNMPWINVCDGYGANSLAAQTYNVKKVPASYLIDKKGELVAVDLFGAALEKKIAELCK